MVNWPWVLLGVLILLALKGKALSLIIFIKKSLIQKNRPIFILLRGLEKNLTFGIFIIENITYWLKKSQHFVLGLRYRTLSSLKIGIVSFSLSAVICPQTTHKTHWRWFSGICWKTDFLKRENIVKLLCICSWRREISTFIRQFIFFRQPPKNTGHWCKCLCTSWFNYHSPQVFLSAQLMIKNLSKCLTSHLLWGRETEKDAAYIY